MPATAGTSSTARMPATTGLFPSVFVTPMYLLPQLGKYGNAYFKQLFSQSCFKVLL
jgi:hypothetical protein